MRKKKHTEYDLTLKRLAAFSATEHARPAIDQTIYADAQAHCLVSTDGFRLFVANFRPNEALPGVKYDAAAFQKGLFAPSPVTEPFPVWRNVVPSPYRRGKTCAFYVPEWCARLRSLDNVVVGFREGVLDIACGDASDIKLDLALVAPFAGEELFIHYAGAEDGILLTPECNPDPFAHPWFAVIHPYRIESQADAYRLIGNTIVASRRRMPTA